MTKSLAYVYFAVAAIELFAECTGNVAVRFFSKPLLMLVLILYFTRHIIGSATTTHKLMVAAFIFSWVGDVALMFVPSNAGDISLMGLPKDPNFFLVGLAGFLLTQILYSIAFARVTDKNAKTLLSRKFWVFLPLLLYMGALLYLLIPAIGNKVETKPFLVPVLIYSATIALMVFFSLNRYKRVNDISFALVFGGALLFMFSDSIIAVNKFIQPFPTAGIFIMTLYITAQYFIAKGMLKQGLKE